MVLSENLAGFTVPPPYQVPTYGNYGPIAIDPRLNPGSHSLEPFSNFPPIIPTHTSVSPLPVSLPPQSQFQRQLLLQSPSLLQSESALQSQPQLSSQLQSQPRPSQPQPQVPKGQYMCNWNLNTVGDIWREWA